MSDSGERTRKRETIVIRGVELRKLREIRNELSPSDGKKFPTPSTSRSNCNQSNKKIHPLNSVRFLETRHFSGYIPGNLNSEKKFLAGLSAFEFLQFFK